MCVMLPFAVVPSTRIVSANGQTPQIAASSFVAPNASVIGNVELGHGSSVWYGAVVKGKPAQRDN
jgi:carbonic anhydrase/acetyltransferase-like protein (isoleucine patch superfamily)